jgi:predicted transcriptional regulator
MTELLKIYLCQECGETFLFVSDKEDHQKLEGHRLFQTEPLGNELSSAIPSGESHFNPTVTTLFRVLKVLLERNSIGRTSLCQAANIHYGRLVKCLTYLQDKGCIEHVVEEARVRVRLTVKGREFASALLTLQIL